MRAGLLAAVWVAGVLLGFAVDAGPLVALLLAASAGLTALVLRLLGARMLAALLAAVLFVGLLRVELHQQEDSPRAELGQTVVAMGSIADDPETTSRRVRFELQVAEVEYDRPVSAGEAVALEERWLVYASPSPDLVQLRDAPYFRYGDRVIVRGAPQAPEPIDGFDYPAYLASHGITATMFALDAQVVGEGGTPWRRWIYALRGKLADSIDRSMPYPESALAAAVLLGKRESLPDELAEEFRGAGAAHLLAISGLHVGVLLAVVASSAAWLLGRQRPTYLFVAGAAVWLYALMAGAPPSALRAAAMGSVYLAALGFGRPSSVLPALALAAALMTAASPGLVRQISFQLSFAAVAGIALVLALWGGRLNWGVSPAAGWVRRTTGWMAALAVVSAAATLATWPLVAVTFGEVALLGVPVSLLTVPVMAPLIVAAAGAALAGAIVPPMGVVLGWIAAAPAAWVIGVVTVIPSWTTSVGQAGPPLLLAWYGALGAALLAARPYRIRRVGRSIAAIVTWVVEKWRDRAVRRPGGWMRPDVRLSLPDPRFSFPAAALLIAAAVILLLRAADGPDGRLHLHFLDVGQGDSTLIVTPTGRQMLIDGGPDGNVVSQRLAETLPGGDRSLDVVLLTHLDSDHSQGLLAVLDRFAVGAVLTGPNTAESPVRPEWEQTLARKEILPVEVRAGHRIVLEDAVELEVLNPAPGRPLGDTNNDSVAVRLHYGNVSALLTADMEDEAELRLVDSGAEISSTVLKAGHHGSGTSSSQAFLDAVGPEIAVVSAGLDNQYGHPAADVLERLEASVGPQNVYRTDLQGTVEFVSDGATWWVQTER